MNRCQNWEHASSEEKKRPNLASGWGIPKLRRTQAYYLHSSSIYANRQQTKNGFQLCLISKIRVGKQKLQEKNYSSSHSAKTSVRTDFLLLAYLSIFKIGRIWAQFFAPEIWNCRMQETIVTTALFPLLGLPWLAALEADQKVFRKILVTRHFFSTPNLQRSPDEVVGRSLQGSCNLQLPENFFGEINWVVAILLQHGGKRQEEKLEEKVIKTQFSSERNLKSSGMEESMTNAFRFSLVREGDTATTTKSADNKSIESLNREVCRWCRFSRSVRPSRKWFYVNAINLRKRKIPSQIEISRESRVERRRPFSAKSHTGHKTPKWEKEREWGGKREIWKKNLQVLGMIVAFKR